MIGDAKLQKIVEMKVIELLKLNRGMLDICSEAGIRMDDVRYIDLYNDYCRMVEHGDKVSYAVAALAERYGICERKVYALVKRYKSDCNSLIFGGGKI